MEKCILLLFLLFLGVLHHRLVPEFADIVNVDTSLLYVPDELRLDLLAGLSVHHMTMLLKECLLFLRVQHAEHIHLLLCLHGLLVGLDVLSHLGLVEVGLIDNLGRVVKVDEVLKKHNVEKMGVTSGSGCMITILITITSTLSLLLML